jgi:hypothetical protein
MEEDELEAARVEAAAERDGRKSSRFVGLLGQII